MTTEMSPERVQQILQNPTFQTLDRQRWRLGMTLTIIQLFIYFGFILVVALAPDYLRQSWRGGVTTLGIPIGIGVILSAFILCGIYVWFANSRFDALNQRIQQEFGQ